MTTPDFDPDNIPLDALAQSDMSTLMDSLQPTAEPIPMPWDADGNLTAFDTVVGTPAQDAQFWQMQTTPFTCAVMAQCGIIGAFTGDPISEAQLVYEATVNGWLSDGGMSPLDVGNLLELHGIGCHVQMGTAIEDLMAELAQGHKVIVGLDSGEIWNQDHPLEDFFQQSADHAIWVTGVDLSDPANPKVIVNDSGDPTGAGKAYDLALFVDAWQDSGFFYVATDDAPPDFSLAASQFNPATGVFPELAAYFGDRFPDFQHQLQDSANQGLDITPGAPFGDAANLSESPITVLDQTARNQLFQMI